MASLTKSISRRLNNEDQNVRINLDSYYSSTDYHLYPDNVIIRYNTIRNEANHIGIGVPTSRTGGGASEIDCEVNYEIYGNEIYNGGTSLDGIKIDEGSADLSGSDIQVYFNTIATEGGNPFRAIIAGGAGEITLIDNILFNDWVADNFHWVCIIPGGTVHSNNTYYTPAGGDWASRQAQP